ncbi:hypothetical protein CYMTET_35487, partial [Cymbomonas tetramitiformis]
MKGANGFGQDASNASGVKIRSNLIFDTKGLREIPTPFLAVRTFMASTQSSLLRFEPRARCSGSRRWHILPCPSGHAMDERVIRGDNHLLEANTVLFSAYHLPELGASDIQLASAATKAKDCDSTIAKEEDENWHTILRDNSFEQLGNVTGGIEGDEDYDDVDAYFAVPNASHNNAGYGQLRDPEHFDFRPFGRIGEDNHTFGAYLPGGEGTYYFIAGPKSYIATIPIPPHESEDVRTDQQLMWLPSQRCVSQRIVTDFNVSYLNSSENIYTPDPRGMEEGDM